MNIRSKNIFRYYFKFGTQSLIHRDKIIYKHYEINNHI